MFDPILIAGVNPAILALLPLVVIALTLAIREAFKAAGKEIPPLATQAVAFVLSAAAVGGTFALSGAALPVDFAGWSSLIVSLFTLQMAVYEVIIKRVVEALSK